MHEPPPPKPRQLESSSSSSSPQQHFSQKRNVFSYPTMTESTSSTSTSLLLLPLPPAQGRGGDGGGVVYATSSTIASSSSSSASSSSSPSSNNNTPSSSSAVAAMDATRRMTCGGLAGMIAKTATNPLERIKMLSQTGEHGLKAQGTGSKSGSSSSQVGVMNLYRTIIKNEGIIGLWAGNGANLLRVFPAKAVVFSSNDLYQGFFRQLSGTSPNERLHGVYAFLAGGFAGMSATACTYPLDFARGRISGKLGRQGSTKEYNGIIRTVVLTVKDEGIRALYKGVTPTLLGAMPYEGIKFGTVSLLEKLFPLQQQEASNNSSKSSPFRKMMFGGMGGVMAGLLTYPNDTVRRLLQLQGSRGTNTQFTGYWDVVQKTYQAEGITRFYRGMTINIIRMAPNAAVQFGSYELLKQWSADYF